MRDGGVVMAQPASAAVLRIIRSAAGTDGSATSDRDLLRRFALHNDQTAFAALVRRHAAMVLGICRRSLPSLQDAEDACQATFLVLAQKAHSTRWQSSIVNWLYATARKVSRNARVTAQRRARREVRAAVPEAVQPVDRMSGRELLAALDEELDRLPARYREPLMLCYLEGLTRDEAAARLGVPAATLKIRLERGRKRLGAALTSRGCVYGAGLLALAATSPAGASPSRLVQRVLAAVSGSAPATVAALAKGVAVQTLLKKSLLVLVALVGSCALGLGAWSLVPAAAKPPEDAPKQVQAGKPTAKAPPQKAQAGLPISGQVIDPHGKPLAGAQLLLLGLAEAPTEVGTSGPDGRFQIRLPSQRPDRSLVARADGAGIAFVETDRIDPSRPVELRTVADRPIRGRVVDTEGKPVSGAQVSVTYLGAYPGDSVNPFLTQWKWRGLDAGLPAAAHALWLSTDAQRPLRDPHSFLAATTGADGRFTISGLGAERFIGLRFAGGGIAQTQAWVVNREGFNAKPYNDEMRNKMPRGMELQPGINLVLQGPDPTIVAEREKPIRGVVKEADTGRALTGVRVSLQIANSGLNGVPTAITDADGRYELHGIRKARSYTLQVRSNPAAGLLGRQLRVADSSGYEPITADVPVARGVVITGRILDASTGKGLYGYATVGILSDNAFIRSRPEFAEANSYADFQDTAEDGTFRVVSIPGRVLLMGGPVRQRGKYAADPRYKLVHTDPKYPHYFPQRKQSAGIPVFLTTGGALSLIQGTFCKVLDLQPGTTLVKQDIAAEPASAQTVKLQDPQGRPLSGAWVTGINPTMPYRAVHIESDACTAYGVEAGQPRLMAFLEPTHKLAATLSLKGDERGSVTVKLRPTGSLRGRLVSEDGKPLAGITVESGYQDQEAREMSRHRNEETVTDAGGAFTIDGMIPGLEFKLFRQAKPHGRRAVMRRVDAWMLLVEKAFKVQSGEILDVGDIKVLADRGNDGD